MFEGSSTYPTFGMDQAFLDSLPPAEGLFPYDFGYTTDLYQQFLPNSLELVPHSYQDLTSDTQWGHVPNVMDTSRDQAEQPLVIHCPVPRYPPKYSHGVGRLLPINHYGISDEPMTDQTRYPTYQQPFPSRQIQSLPEPPASGVSTREQSLTRFSTQNQPGT